MVCWHNEGNSVGGPLIASYIIKVCETATGPSGTTLAGVVPIFQF